MKKFLPIALAVSSAMHASTLLAIDTAAQNLKEALAVRYPDIKIERVAPSVLPGLYEVITPSEIVYADAKGDHLVLGQIVDTRTRENLTEKSWNDINKMDFSALPLDLAIKIVKGDGSRKLAVFADPFCPYCQEFESNIKNIGDITIYVFLYPLEELHPGASIAAREIWCAEDPGAAWVSWMVDEKAPAKTECQKAPVEAVVKLGEKLRINSTPTLLFTDGTRIPGSVNLDVLEKKLASAGK